tara:strand:+ start:365 stop:631 length:267 start_codon:yes stop_codon:yes gene_type:complete
MYKFLFDKVGLVVIVVLLDINLTILSILGLYLVKIIAMTGWFARCDHPDIKSGEGMFLVLFPMCYSMVFFSRFSPVSSSPLMLTEREE